MSALLPAISTILIFYSIGTIQVGQPGKSELLITANSCFMTQRFCQVRVKFSLKDWPLSASVKGLQSDKTIDQSIVQKKKKKINQQHVVEVKNWIEADQLET